MKKIVLSLLFGSLLLAGCSSSDESGESNSENNFIDAKTGKFWVYDVTGANIGRDSLYVKEINNGNLKLNTLEEPFGFYSAIIKQSNLKITANEILASGTFDLPVLESVPLNIPIENFIIFKKNGNPNELLSTVSKSVETVFDDIPIVIDYKTTSYFVKKYDHLDIPNYGNADDVVEMKIVINLKISAKIMLDISETPILIPILNSQDAIKSTQYYVNNIGNVYTQTNTDYELVDLSNFDIELPIPQSGSYVIKELLVKTN